MLSVAVLIFAVLLGLLLTGFGWASGHNLWLSLDNILSDPWGAVALLDLGAGLVFAAAWIAAVEPRRGHASVWIVALVVLGNVATLTFLLWRSRNARNFSDLFVGRRDATGGSR